LGDDIVARIGGDEFTIILDNIRDVSDPIRVANRIQAALSAPFVLSGQKVFTTASIGIALSSTGYHTVHEIQRDADIAMYRAKAGGRARWEVFDEVMREHAVANLQLEAELHQALHLGELRVHYQPIVSLSDQRVRGFEALVRWQHPTKGMISPSRFIPLAEEIGLIRPIGSWVLIEACRQLKAWQVRFPSDPPLTMSVNLSAKQLEQTDLTKHVREIIETTGIARGSLKLELTESALMGDAEHADRLFAEFQLLGVQLSLDDFGTGYSSLSRLRRLPIDTLKIDRSFINQMGRDMESRQIVEIILQLARALQLEVIAEGAETGAEIALLRELGCQHVQGFYFFEPRDTTDAEAILFAQDSVNAGNLPG
jgi:predicted signal transduction protein with EAL and GGDEF domain